MNLDIVDVLRQAPMAGRFNVTWHKPPSLGRASEIEQNNWLPVSVERLLWVFCYTSLWPFFFNLLAFILLPATKTVSQNSSESGSICSHLFYWSELFPSFPWLLTQPARATCKPLQRERERGGEREGGGTGLQWEKERERQTSERNVHP